MNELSKIDEKWLKSAIIGTVWASSEIVLGSFLHNLRIPFSGSILTAIGVVILISVSFVWKEKGLFWRAGLICAIMKTMSPSAVIFGPMIAIFVESLLLEFSVRLLGKNYFGFVIGSILAISWSFAQKIINFLIFYGFNIVELYKSIMKFTEKQLNLQFDTLWLPILTLFSIYALFGIVSAIIGIRTGKKILSQPLIFKTQTIEKQDKKNNNPVKNDYSLCWLFLNILFIISSLLTIALLNWKIWVATSVLIVLIWILKYKRALRQLLRPKFWIFFVALTMLTSFVFSQLQSKTLTDAFLIGIEMNFRATLLILGFSVLGTELYNPKISSFFAKTYFKKLPFALEIASESLPQVISNIPDFKIIIKNPTQIVSQLIAFAEMRFRELSEDFSKPKIFIITSKKDSGKTTFVKQIIPFFIQNSIKIGGIFTQKQVENQQRIGYDVVDIQTNKSEIFLRESGENDYEKIGKFFIFPQGVKFGKESLRKVKNTDIQLVIIDEIGHLELTGKAWANEINELLQYQNFIFLWIVRDTFLAEIIEFWKLKNYKIIDLQKISTQTANQIILNQLIGKV